MTNGDALRKVHRGIYLGKSNEEIVELLRCNCESSPEPCPALSFCESLDSDDPAKAPIPCSKVLERWLKRKADKNVS